MIPGRAIIRRGLERLQRSSGRGRRIWRNWAGNQQCEPEALALPDSEDAIVELVHRARRQGTTLKVVGAGHSWSDIACTNGIQVSLDRHAQVLGVNREPEASADGLPVPDAQMTVSAGIRLKNLNKALADSGLGMPVLGSVSEQSIAGAISTGTHGSGAGFGNLATTVASMRLVTGTGEVLVLDEQRTELLRAARVGLGSLGIISQVTLNVDEAFNLAEETWIESFDSAVSRIDELAEAHEYFKLWWLPHTDKVGVYVANRTDEPLTPRDFQRRFDESVVSNGIFTVLLKAGRLHGGLIPWVNRLVAATHFREERRVAPAVNVFNVPQVPIHREMEYAVHMDRSSEALHGLRDMIRGQKHHVNFIVEARFVAPDQNMLSPAHGRPSCQIGAYMGEVPHINRYFADFERLMFGLGGRPHWGKEFSLGAEELSTLYPDWDHFGELRRELDPDGIFENDFTRRVLP